MAVRNIYRRNTLQPEERLKLRKQIEMLFREGEAFSFFPARVIYRFVKSESEHAFSPVKAGFSIPKKNFKKAVDRNRNRRLLKEAWRLQKHALYQNITEPLQLHCFLILNGRKKLTFEEANEVVARVMNALIQKVKSFTAQHNSSKKGMQK